MDAAWLRFLPGFVASNLSGRGALQVALANIGWLSPDRLLRMGVASVLTVWLVRRLQPGRYGPPGAAPATVLTHMLILVPLRFFKETRGHFRLNATLLGIGAESDIPKRSRP